MADKPFFDEAELKELGIAIKDAKARAAKLSELNAALEMRTGEVLIKQWSDKQLDEFELMIDNNASEKVRLVWLKKNYPGYEDVVNEVYRQMKAELKHGRI